MVKKLKYSNSRKHKFTVKIMFVNYYFIFVSFADEDTDSDDCDYDKINATSKLIFTNEILL